MCTREGTKCNLQEYIRISFTCCFRVQGTKVWYKEYLGFLGTRKFTTVVLRSAYSYPVLL